MGGRTRHLQPNSSSGPGTPLNYTAPQRLLEEYQRDCESSYAPPFRILQSKSQIFNSSSPYQPLVFNRIADSRSYSAMVSSGCFGIEGQQLAFEQTKSGAVTRRRRDDGEKENARTKP